MPRVRRTRYLAFTCADEKTVDVGGLLRGRVELATATQPLALSILTGTQHELSREDLELAVEVPEAWTTRDQVLRDRDPADAARLDDLARKGVVVTDDADPELAELRRRDETLSADHWSPQSALYHFMARWRGVRVDPGPEFDLDAGMEELTKQAIAQLERLGKPPAHFVTLTEAEAVSPLPPAQGGGQLYDALARRKTSRGFDRQTPVTLEQLATILGTVWGCHGVTGFSEEVAMVKKTSPSGGGLHPIEVYPLVRDVAGIPAGLYHYNIRDHTLELGSSLTSQQAEEVAFEFTAGQTYFESAHVLFLMAARFNRSFWKYQNHTRAYGVLLMDAGHLSQTFYLVCTELGLGAFVTAAINGANVEEALGIDGFREGAIAICGCGPPGPAPPGLEPRFSPYPR